MINPICKKPSAHCALAVVTASFGFVLNMFYWGYVAFVDKASVYEDFMSDPLPHILVLVTIPVMMLIGRQIVKERELISQLTEAKRELERSNRAMKREIEERKRVEAKLRRALEEIRAVQEIERSIVSMPDLQSLLEFIVHKARELTGADVSFYSFVEGDVIRYHAFAGIRTPEFKQLIIEKGKGLGWLVLEDKKPVVVEDFFNCGRIKDAPFEVVRKEGLVSFLAVPLFTRRGSVMGVLYVANRRRTKFTEEQIRTLQTLATQTSVAVEHARLLSETVRAYRELKKLDEFKSNIIANISHELKTPITIARGLVELSVKEETEQRSELLQKAIDALDRLTDLVENFIELSDMQRRGLSLEMERIDIVELVREAVKSREKQALEKGVEVKVRCNRERCVVVGDPFKLRRAIINLLDNAIKFNRPSGKVMVEVGRENGEVRIEISDEGIGIPRQKVGEIFEPLTQLDCSPTRRYGGAGIGLAVTKSIIEAHGGRIWVESEPGMGSTFYISLPLIKEGG